MRSSMAGIAAASHGRKTRVIEVRLSAEMSHQIRPNKRITVKTHGEMWVDTDADTTCAGAGCTVSAYTDQYVSLRCTQTAPTRKKGYLWSLLPW